MKKILNIICHTAVISAVLLSSVSCLEKYPGSAIPEEEAMKTFSDAEQHMIGVYASLKSSALYSGLLTLLPDIQSDLVLPVVGNSNKYGNFYQWKILSTESEISSVYASLYAVIGNCNFYLDNIETVKASVTDDDKLDALDIYTGEVYTIRALCYSELLKCFCKAYDPATAESELGVVLRTRYTVPEPVKRASLYDSYAFVVADLERAEELLDDDQDAADSPYITAAAAQALRARIALYMQDWDTAIKYSSILIDEKTDKDKTFALSSTMLEGGSYGGSLYSQFGGLWYFDSGEEIIWKIGFTGTSYGGALGTTFLNYTRDYTYFYPDYVPSQWVLGLYTESDYRADAYFGDSSVTGIPIGFDHGLSWPVLLKYFGNREFTNNYRLFGVSMPKPLRLAEQYLIRAEAYCRSNTQQNFTLASKDISKLRAARIAGGGQIGLNANNWKEEISEERVRELYMEGFRLNDLKRWGMGFEREDPEVDGIQEEGSDLKVDADDPLFVWPIPQHELDAPGSDILPNDSNK